MAELLVRARPRFGAVVGWLVVAACLTVVGSSAWETPESPAKAAPMTLTFESISNTQVVLGSLASRSQCKSMSKQGTGPYTLTGTDSLTNQSYSFQTDANYGVNHAGTNLSAQLRESKETTGVGYSSSASTSANGRSGVVMLASSGNISFNNSCSGVTVYGSSFGPQVWTQAFAATAGQALSFDWSATGGGDDYEIYAYLVKVSASGASFDYGSAATTTLLAHGRGKTQGWKTTTGLIPSDGNYRFRFVNGTYDASGGYYVGATMYIDPRVLVGQANNITFGTLSDRVTSASNQTFSISASATSGGTVNFTSSTTGRCTVGASTHSGGVSTATVTVLANQTGLCTISADSASTGDYATAATVTRSFTILSAPTAPTNSGGTAVSGTAAVGQVLTAVEGSWADGGSAINATTFQWQSCLPASCSWANVVGATESTILLGSSDIGRQFRVQVTKTNGIGSTTVNSTASSTVAKGNQAALSVSTTTVTFGQVLTLATTGGSGSGAVTFAKVSGTCSVSGNQLTPGDAGSACVVNATKAADAAFNSVTSPDTTITVQRAAQAALSVTTTSGTFGANLTLAASGGSGTGAVTFAKVSGACTLSGTTLTPTAAGSTCIVRATKASDTNYDSVDSAATAVTFAKGSQAALVITSTTATYGDDLTLTTSGGSGTGAVSFSKISGTCTLSGNQLTPGIVGSSCVVQASKAGDDDHLPADSATTSITVGKGSQAALVITSTTATYGEDLTLTTSGGSGTGAVSFSRISGTCTIDGNTLTPGLVGSACVIRATKATDANYNPINSANTSITTEKAAQSGFQITNATSFTTGSTLLLTTTGGQSTGSISWTVVSGTCSLSGSSLTAARGGISCTVQASRAGDSNYLSTSDSVTITVNKIAQSLTFRSSAPSPATVGATYAVSVTSDAFLAPTITVTNQSASVCRISADVVTFTGVGTCVVSASQSGTDVYGAAAASQSITVVAVAAAVTQTTTVANAEPAAQPTPVTAPQSVATTTTTTTIVPQRSGPTTTTTPPTTTTTTTSTTTTIPNQGDPTQPMTDESGNLPELDGGVATAMVRGAEVEVRVETAENEITLTLPNDVEATLGAVDSQGNPLPVSADGVIKVFGTSQIRVKLDGLVPGTTYTAYLFSDPIELGRGVVGPDGAVDETFTVPEDIETGGHTLQLNGVGPNSEVVSLAMGIELIETESNTALTVTVVVLAILGALFIPLRRRRRPAR